jgi:hypothetical protein
MIQWILDHLGVVVIIILFLSQMVRGVLQQSRKADEQRGIRRDEGGEERRVREVQEQIRRQIAARRAGQSPTETPPPREQEAEPRPRAETTQLPEFGGPFGRMLEELQRKAQQQQQRHIPPTPPVLVERHNTPELERQQRLADELKALEEARHVAQRRAAHVAADKRAVAGSEPALRTVARNRLLGDLSDAQSLRRAFVLREVLGTPLGLR